MIRIHNLWFVVMLAAAHAFAASGEGPNALPQQARGADLPPLPPPVTTQEDQEPQEAGKGLTPRQLEAIRREIRRELREANEHTSVRHPDERSEEGSLHGAQRGEMLRSARHDRSKEWSKPKDPKLNFVEMGGYFRTRPQVFFRPDLGTFIPKDGDQFGYGTSQFPPPLSSYRNDPGAANDPEAKRPSDVVFSTDMRLRLDPTFHVSERVRVGLTLDVLDNLVFGSTPRVPAGAYTPHTAPVAFLNHGQSPPIPSINTDYGSALAVKRAWGAVSTPVGELRFGRVPYHFGMGLLYNAGEGINDDFSDTIDGFLFATDLPGGLRLIPAYSVEFAGPTTSTHMRDQRVAVDSPMQEGPRYDLDPSDNAHAALLTLRGTVGDAEAFSPLSRDVGLFHYGLLFSYRNQALDVREAQPSNTPFDQVSDSQVNRDGHAGLGSVWLRGQWGSLDIRTEAVGGVGVIGDTDDLVQQGAESVGSLRLLMGGVALESDYGFLRNRLRIGLDGGWTSGGLRGLDFRNLGSSRVTAFTFHPSYHVDLLLFKRVLGGMTGAGYLRPHIGGFWEHFLIRLDGVPSFANVAGTTPGGSNFLGLEFDVTTAYFTKDHFHLQLQYGMLIPFAGLNHSAALRDENPNIFESYGRAKLAHTLQFLLGVSF
ncbi:MAG: hypothetical protein AAF471_02575 [Myxococcota bacterium]